MRFPGSQLPQNEESRTITTVAHRGTCPGTIFSCGIRKIDYLKIITHITPITENN